MNLTSPSWKYTCGTMSCVHVTKTMILGSLCQNNFAKNFTATEEVTFVLKNHTRHRLEILLEGCELSECRDSLEFSPTCPEVLWILRCQVHGILFLLEIGRLCCLIP